MNLNNIAKNTIIHVLVVLSAVALLSCSFEHEDPRAKDIQKRLDRLQRVEMEFDASAFSPQKKELLKTLIRAGELIHEAYLRQVSPRGVALRDSLRNLNDDLSRNMLRLIIRNGGPFDKLDDFHNFFNDKKKSPGGAFYPDDMMKVEIDNAIALSPEKAVSLQSPYSIVRRDGSSLIAIPFHEAFGQWVTPAAELLNKASNLAEQASLKKFLASRAKALLSDDYHQSHLDWIDVTDSDIDLLLAPDEVYDDALLGIKASYEASVMIKDPVQSAKLEVFTKHLDALEQWLPLEEKYKRKSAVKASPMQIVTDIFRGGDIATGYQAVAATLPNEIRVRVEKGTKKIFWKNMMDARVNHVIIPIGREVIASDQIMYITPEGVFNDVLMHEISHAIGPEFVNDSTTVNSALREHYTSIEEAKADVVGLHSLGFFVNKGIISKEMDRVHHVSALASMFRTIRFGASEAHGKAAICALNYFVDRGAVYRNPITRKWSVVFDKMPAAIEALAHELLLLEATGDYEGAEKFFRQWTTVSKEVQDALNGLSHIPVDVEPVYSVKWE